MDWAWAIPVVALVIWIVANVVRGANEAQKRPPAPQPGNRPRSSNTDIERLLEEINRRRQGQQRRPDEEPVMAQPVRVEPPPVRAPRPRPISRPSVAPPPKPRRVAPPPPVFEAIPVVTAVEPIIAEVLPAQQLTFAEEIALTGPLPMPAVQAPKMAAHLKQLRDLLRGGKGMRTAVILNEILGAPRSQRGRVGAR